MSRVWTPERIEIEEHFLDSKEYKNLLEELASILYSDFCQPNKKARLNLEQTTESNTLRDETLLKRTGSDE